VKNHKIAKNLTTTQARENNKHRFGILRIVEIFNVYLTKFKSNHILLNKIRHRFVLTTKLFTGQSLIGDLHISLMVRIFPLYPLAKHSKWEYYCLHTWSTSLLNQGPYSKHFIFIVAYKCLSLAILSSLVKCLWERPGAYP
jgi:hypothetical protein